RHQRNWNFLLRGGSGGNSKVNYNLARRVVAEALGTAILLAAVVGSGIMAERLSGGNIAIALLANTIATGAALVALIFAFGAVSGAHFNPVVSFAAALEHGLPYREAFAYARPSSPGESSAL